MTNLFLCFHHCLFNQTHFYFHCLRPFYFKTIIKCQFSSWQSSKLMLQLSKLMLQLHIGNALKKKKLSKPLGFRPDQCSIYYLGLNLNGDPSIKVTNLNKNILVNEKYISGQPTSIVICFSKYNVNVYW